MLEHLRDVFVESGYTPAGLRELLHSDPASGLLSFDPLVHSRRLPADAPVSALITLFLFGGAVDERRVRSILGSTALEALLECGLIDTDGARVRAPVDVHPWQDLFLFCDRSADGRFEDQVLGLTPASVTLAYLTVRREGRVALDLGTGCGTEALLAASHSSTAVGTDINPRAVAFAELNARVNGVPNVDLRLGSWFEPVAGRDFDLIVSNPPYVVSPETSLVYRDGGLAGDALCEQVVRDVAAHLSEGGFGTVLSNWICRPGADPAAAPLRWVQDTGCDAVVLAFAADDPLTYAASWNQHLRSTDSRAFEEVVDRWLAYYRDHDVAALGAGAVVLRRRSTSSNWAKVVQAPGMPSGPAGGHVERLFRAHDQLSALGPEQLLQARLAPAEGHRIDHVLTHGSGAYTAQPLLLRIEPGIGLEVRVEPQLLRLLLECDGRRSVGDLLAAATGGPPDPGSAVAQLCLQRFARLVELGILEPRG